VASGEGDETTADEAAAPLEEDELGAGAGVMDGDDVSEV